MARADRRPFAGPGTVPRASPLSRWKGIASGLLLAGALFLPAAQSLAAAGDRGAVPPPPPRHPATLLLSGTVDARHLPPVARATGRGLRIPPFLPRHPRALARFKGYRRRHVVSSPTGPLQVASPSVETSSSGSTSSTGSGGSTSSTGAGLPLMSLDQQVALLGSGQSRVPPDTQVAAGPNDLMELDNATGSIWTKAGALVASFSLDSFFGVPAEDTGMGAFDPRVFYDAASGRWFASASATDPTNTYNQVFLAVSQTSDPTGAWSVYTLEANSDGTLYDQPMTGVSGDKVVVSWDDFSYGAFVGQETWVLQKSQLIAGEAVAGVDFGPDASRFRLVPALGSGTNTAYLVYNNSDPYNLVENTGVPSLGVVAITGTPAQGNVAWNESDPAIAPTAVPPGAVQPGGGPLITTDDDRLLSAVWQNGVLWTAGNDACTPAGASATQPCLRLIQVSTAGGGAEILQDFDVGAAGLDLYYPAVGLDPSGDLFVAFTASSVSLYASVAALVQPAGAAVDTVGPLQLVEAGQGVYCGFDCSAGDGTNRWGDYSAVSPDPANSGVVWVAGEYAASSQDQGDWGTAVEGLTASAG
jgi:hypothetical protein